MVPLSAKETAMNDIDTPANNFGELRQQLVVCQAELGGAINELEGAVAQLRQLNDPNLGKVAGMLEMLSGVLTSIDPVIADIAEVSDEDSLEDHPEKLEKISGVFQRLEELKNQTGI